MNRPLLIVLFVLGVLGRASAAPAISPFSMQLHSMMWDVEGHVQTCVLVKAAGMKMVRDEIMWHRVETEKGVFTWPQNIEANVDATLAAGLEPMIILDYGNHFYDDGKAPHSAEAVAAYANYCRQMASHYRGKIKYWEIWNEPNSGHFWPPKEDPAKYAEVLKAAYKACKEGNPDCVVIGVCTAGVDHRFIQEVLRYGGMKWMDVLSIHPYCYPTPPEQSFSTQIAQVRKTMNAYGGQNKPIWITEVGWPTHIGENSVTPETQAHMLVRAYMEAISSGVQTLFWYWFGNDGPNPNYNEDHFGIRFRDGSPKPAYIAYQTMTRMLDGANYVRSLGLGAKARGKVFRRGEETIAVLWTPDSLETITLKVGSGPVEIYGELGGTPEVLYPVNGLISLTLNEAPIYLECDEDLTQSSVKASHLFEISPLVAEVPAADSRTVEVRIQNPCSSVLLGAVKIAAPSQDVKSLNFRVESRQRATVEYKVTPPSDSREPIDIPVKVLVDDRLAGILRTRLRVVSPLKVSMEPVTPIAQKRPAVRFLLQNKRSTPLTAHVQLSGEPQGLLSETEIIARNIAPGKARSYTVSLEDSNSAPDRTYPVSLTAVVDGLTIDPVTCSGEMSFLTSSRATRPVVIDGQLDEWSGTVPIRLNCREQLSFGKDLWKGISDCSAEVLTAWDSSYFYLAAKVIDDRLCGSLLGHNCFKNDGLEIYLDVDRIGDAGQKSYSEDDFQYGFFQSPKGPLAYRWGKYDAPSPGAKLAIRPASNLGPDKNLSGYVLEGCIPVKELGFVPKPGMRIGFSVSLNDDDDPVGEDVDHQDRRMNWVGGNDNWRDPTQLGELFLTQ